MLISIYIIIFIIILLTLTVTIVITDVLYVQQYVRRVRPVLRVDDERGASDVGQAGGRGSVHPGRGAGVAGGQGGSQWWGRQRGRGSEPHSHRGRGGIARGYVVWIVQYRFENQGKYTSQVYYVYH